MILRNESKRKFTTMNKKNVSTFNHEMQDQGVKALFEKEYKKFALAEILVGLMEENNKTVRSIFQRSWNISSHHSTH